MTSRTEWDARTREDDEEPQLHVVAFYENLESGEWAKEIFDRIRSRAPLDAHATPGLWRFDTLKDQSQANQAIADAADATVIIVAAPGTSPLPNLLLECIEKALLNTEPRRVGLVAIVEDLDRLAKERLPAYRQLQALSRKARLRFFSLPARNLTRVAPSEDSFRFAANRVVKTSLSIERRSHRGWGINE